MKDKQFQVIGEVENVDIPEDKEEVEGPHTKGGFKFRVNKENISNFIENLRKNNGRSPMPGKKEIEILSKETGMKIEEIEAMMKDLISFFNNSIDEKFINNLEEIVKEKGEQLNQKDIDAAFDELFKTEKNKKDEDEDLFEDEIEINERQTNSLKFSTLFDLESFGLVVCNKNKNIWEDFKSVYGEKDIYEVIMFQPTIKVSNAISGLSFIKYLKYVEHTENFILFKGIPVTTTNTVLEPIYIAAIQYQNEFEFVIPEFGNSFNVETGDLFDQVSDSDLYVTDRNGNNILIIPADLEKIKVGLNLVLFEDRTPFISVQEFGRVVSTEARPMEDMDNAIYIGNLKSNEGEKSVTFKEDYNLEEVSFDFYVKLKKEYSEKTLINLSDFLSSIDFNENKKVGTELLKVDRKKRLYIELDLDGLPDNIDRWIDN
jgi:hypothetical protein